MKALHCANSIHNSVAKKDHPWLTSKKTKQLVVSLGSKAGSLYVICTFPFKKTRKVKISEIWGMWFPLKYGRVSMLYLGGVTITHEDDSQNRTIYNPWFGILMAKVWGHGSSFKPTLPYTGWCIYPNNDISNSCNENNIISYIYI